MKEITRIITAQITIIEQMPEYDAESVLACKEEAQENVKNTLQNLYNADDVKVEIQDFLMDKMPDKIKVPPYGSEYEQGFADGFNKAIDEMKGNK